MQLSPQTLEVLKNFSQINTGIFVKKGTTLQTTEQSNRSMAAYATIKEEFPQEFGVYDLPQLLSLLSISKTLPEIDFHKKYLVISHLSGRSKINYRFCSEEMLVVPGENKPSVENPDIEFKLEEDDYSWVTTTAKILQTPNVAIKSDGEKVFLRTFDVKNDSKADQSLEISAKGNGTKYSMVMDLLYFNKLIPGSYDVKISKDGVSHFKCIDSDIEYFVAMDNENSSFGG